MFTQFFAELEIEIPAGENTDIEDIITLERRECPIEYLPFSLKANKKRVRILMGDEDGKENS